MLADGIHQTDLLTSFGPLQSTNNTVLELMPYLRTYL